ncbi:MAG: flavohemoglobin expression-modulating QEGLA motif protein [Kofleriaceae bacterium]
MKAGIGRDEAHVRDAGTGDDESALGSNAQGDRASGATTLASAHVGALDSPKIDSSVLEEGHRARDLAAVVVERIAAGKPVRRTLEGGGRLHVDRALPFLCVYRPRGGQVDTVARDFVRTQAAYLVSPLGRDISAFVDAVVDELAKACGACLLLELWAGEDPAGPFRIHAAHDARIATTVDALADALREMKLEAMGEVSVEIVENHVHPVGDKPLVETGRAAKAGVLAIGLEVPPRYRPPASPEGGASTTIYPFVAQAMARELAHALQRCFYEFARVQTPVKPAHFHAMGRRYVVRAVREADHALAEISSTFDFLMAVTPVNIEAAWQEFCESGRKKMPVLRYWMLEVDPAIAKRQLYDLPLDRLEDPVLAQLLHDKRRELDRQLGLLEDRDTASFVHGSVQLYGSVDDSLLAEARAILACPVPARREEARLGCEVVAARAREEIERYRQELPSLASKVWVRDDIVALMVSRGDVCVPSRIEVTQGRLHALLQHEVGTHVVTYANGFAQPLRVLGAGLAGYEALQEGLALLAEYVAGGLDVERLRLIAARAVAVRRLVDGAGFCEVVEELVESGLTPRGAFGTAVRVWRGGGLTKDAIYLRGLRDLLVYLREGHDVDTLLVGKIAFDQVPLVEELVRRGVLRGPAIRPHWLEGSVAHARLERVRGGVQPLELLEAA